MIKHKEKEYFPKKGELIVIHDNGTPIIWQNWINSRIQIKEKPTIDPGEAINTSLFFAIDKSINSFGDNTKLTLVITDSWGIKHDLELNKNHLGKIKHKELNYVDGYAMKNNLGRDILLFDLSKYPVKQY